jgi:predicted KAP-like P-loop ATPase
MVRKFVTQIFILIIEQTIDRDQNLINISCSNHSTVKIASKFINTSPS